MRKNIFLRSLSLAICLLLTLPLIIACGNGANDDNSNDPALTSENLTVSNTELTTPVTLSPEEEAWNALPDNSFGGYNVRVLMRDNSRWIADIFSDGLNGELVNDAVYERNTAVCEKLGVTLTLFRSSNYNYETDAINTILADSDDYDVIVPHARASFSYAQRGCLIDWNTLSSVDLNASWWDQDARNSFTIYDRLYMMVGGLSHNSLGSANALLFNKNIFDKFNQEYPYQTVFDGNWTFDKFSELVLLASDDLNGDGAIKPADDAYGYVTYQWVGPMQVLCTGGGRIVDKDENGDIYLSINTERNLNVYNAYFKLTDQKNCYIEGNRDENKSIFDSRVLFSQGRAMFTDMNLDETQHLAGMTDAYGIIPSPKFDEETDKYYTYVDSGTNLFIIPITNPDPERTATVLEALSIEGARRVFPAYYELTLKTKRSDDETSAQMIDLIKEGRVYDLGYYNSAMVGNSIASTGYNLVTFGSHNFTTFCKANSVPANASLKKALEAYSQLP